MAPPADYSVSRTAFARGFGGECGPQFIALHEPSGQQAAAKLSQSCPFPQLITTPSARAAERRRRGGESAGRARSRLRTRTARPWPPPTIRQRRPRGGRERSRAATATAVALPACIRRYRRPSPQAARPRSTLRSARRCRKTKRQRQHIPRLPLRLWYIRLRTDAAVSAVARLLGRVRPSKAGSRRWRTGQAAGGRTGCRIRQRPWRFDGSCPDQARIASTVIGTRVLTTV